jgi:hypothetical protein
MRLPGAAITSPGEMVLPKVTTELPFVADAPLKRAGISLAYDEVNANLRNLDGLGGTYAITSSTGSTLSIADGGLRIGAKQSLVYLFSRKNVFGPTGDTYGSNVSSSVTFPGDAQLLCNGTLVWPSPDLRSFYLLLMDARGWVVSLAGIHILEGDAVEPTCVPVETGLVFE